MSKSKSPGSKLPESKAPETARLSLPVPSRPFSSRGLMILLADIILFVVLLNFLPFGHKENIGLAITAFVAVLWLTEAIHLTLTALTIPILAVATGILKSPADALRSFGDPIIFLFFGGFALAAALRIQKLDLMFANWLLRLTKGRLGAAAVMIFVFTAAISMWISNTATTAMIFPLAMGILSSLDEKLERKTFVFMLLGVAYSANIGGLGTVVGSPPGALASRALNIEFFTWMTWGVPIIILLLPLMIFIIWLVLRPNLRHRVEISTEKIPWTLPRVLAAAIFILTALTWIFSSQISAALGGVKQLDAMVAIVAAVLVGVSGVASWKQIQTNTDWGILMLFGGGLVLSRILGESGASALLGKGVVNVFGGSNPIIIVLVAAAFIIFLTEISSNTATAALMIPLFTTIGEALGMPAQMLVLIVGFGATLAFMLPVATPPNAIVYGSGYIRQSEMVVAGFWVNIASVLVISAYALLFWNK